MITLNGVKRDNRKKPTYYSQCSSNFNRILFFILKNLIFKKDDLIKNDDIKNLDFRKVLCWGDSYLGWSKHGKEEN